MTTYFDSFDRQKYCVKVQKSLPIMYFIKHMKLKFTYTKPRAINVYMNSIIFSTY